MSSKKKAASSARVGDAHEKSTDKLSLNKIPSSSPRNNSTRGSGSPAGVVHGIPPFHQDSTRLHSSQYHPGADGMQHHQHAHVRAPALPSIGDGTARLDEGRGEGTCDGPGAWAGSRHPARPFSPNYSLAIPGKSGKKGPPRGLGGKGVFCLSQQVFEIDAKERQCKTLLTARNLMAVVREPQEYVINILPRKMPKEVVPGEHYTVKDLPIYQALKEADAEKRRALLTIGRRRKTKGPFGRLPDRNAAQTLLQIKLQRKRKLVKNGKGVKEPTPPKNLLLRQLSTRRSRLCAPDGGSGAESQSQPSDDPDRGSCSGEGATSKRPRSARNLRSGLLGRLQDRQQEIEVSCSSAHAHPEGGEVEMVTETPAVGCTRGDPSGPFSYAELEDKLKQIPPGLTMYAFSQDLVSGLRGMANQYDLFTDLLRTTDYMKAFARHKDTEDQLRLRLGRPKPAYPPPGENEALRADLAEQRAGRNHGGPPA
ncbi:hypothetical protein CK203_097387 [Vitis vinifera]|uniref:Uncharacterized protein n=1 Tax=Vitis vinifera TaxID=29760 RepID=A0A438EYJ4_VITVI|nr:hypothetical protein CK203_097387 [Vitis vinifera]